MIGTYIAHLYSNCKALAKTEAYDFNLLAGYFNGEVDKFVKEQGFENGPDLLSVLITKKHEHIMALLNACPFIHAFYLVNSLSEYNCPETSLDELNRYKFESSIQKVAGIAKNAVLDLIFQTVKNDPFLKRVFYPVSHKSFFFLSHDIDSLYGSLLQDGLWALKNKRPDVLLKLFVNVLMARPHWFNIDLIMNLESEYDFKSTFYWLVNKGKIDQRQTNSDYNIKSGKLKRVIEKVKSTGFENGLHKSISHETFESELIKLAQSAKGNRYHYLKFRLPDAYAEIERSGLQLDASLGFAEHFGFRNNYGYPFSPYNIEKETHYSFTEVPLTIMDGTFQRYMKVPVNQTSRSIIDFLEKNSHDCLLSILWHNTFFTDYKYKGYKEEYIKILQYLYDEKFKNMNQTEIIANFSWKK